LGQEGVEAAVHVVARHLQRRVEFPLCLYSITQLPTVLKVTTPAEIEHTLADPVAIVIATGRDELAVAVGV
jgi:hypothetical protein